jgi:hypothetical protein
MKALLRARSFNTRWHDPGNPWRLLCRTNRCARREYLTQPIGLAPALLTGQDVLLN